MDLIVRNPVTEPQRGGGLAMPDVTEYAPFDPDFRRTTSHAGRIVDLAAGGAGSGAGPPAGHVLTRVPHLVR